jgi:integrase
MFYTRDTQLASIKQRDQSFQVQIRRKDTQTFSKCFKTLTEAKAWARQMDATIDMGNSPILATRNSNVPTLMQAFARYKTEVLPHKKSARSELSFIDLWQQHKLSTKQLASITPKDIASYRDEQLNLGKAPATVVRRLGVLSHLFTIAIKEWGYSLDNPVLKIRKPRVANARSRRPSAAELDTVLSNLATDEMRVFVQLASETAMRRSELFNLTWSQVDTEKRFVFLPDTKNGSSRTVVISSKAAALFKAHQGTKTALERVFSFCHCDTPSKAFGRAVRLSRASYELQCEQGGIEPIAGYLQDLRLHDMRHEATSSLFERGLSSMEVASITGHKTLSMLQRYTHLSAAHLHAKLG